MNSFRTASTNSFPNMPDFSVVVPVYNEEDSITPLYFSLKRVMDSLKKSYEIIFINDGSQDNTLEALRSLNRKSAGLCIIDLNMRCGKSLALQAGFDRAQGKIIITLDGDLQNDPADIPRLLNKMEEGYDVVCGWRRIRRDPCVKKAASVIANYIRRVSFHENVHDVGCTLRVYTADSIKGLRLYRQRHRFLTALLKKQGARIGELEVEHRFRQSGYSKYGTITRLFSSIPDFFALLREYYCRPTESSSSNIKKYTSGNPLLRLTVRNFLRRVARILDNLPMQKLLDAGCGEGYVLPALSQGHPRGFFVAVDKRIEALVFARRKNPEVRYIEADILQLPFKEKVFDIVACTEVIEHIAEYRQVLQELKRVSAGYCLISVPYEPFFSLFRLLGGKNLLRGGRHPEHIHRFTKKEIIEKIAEHFKIEKVIISLPWLVILGRAEPAEIHYG